ncbi:MAG: hypothetical protein LBT18_01985, partial [Endomicrobium sp.]|jgi:hypothetical protein|nr:hypothetical protein [Endomicrobium sp.]
LYQVDINDVIRNYELKNQEGFLFCLFDAISNALYSSIDNTNIKIKIDFTRQYKANEIIEDKENYIKSFTITDNGVGFIDDNFEGFTRKIYKTNHDCGKGLGRMAFLKVFQDVSIDSYFKKDSKIFHRSFIFNTSKIKDNKEEAEASHSIETSILFNNIKFQYQKNTLNGIDYYHKEILNHFYIFLYYLVEKNKTFEIKLTDDSGKVSERIISAEKLKNDKVKKESVSIIDVSVLDSMDNKIDFEILHIKTKNIGGNKAFYVVDERAAGGIDNLNLPPNSLEDKNGFKYFYNVYLKSSYLNRFLNESRTQLSIPTDKNNPNNSFITSDKIETLLKEKVDKFLNYEIGVLEKKNEDRVRDVLTDNKYNAVSNSRAYLYLLADETTKKSLLDNIRYNDSEKNIISKIKGFHEELQIKTIEKINILVEHIRDVKGEVDLKKLEQEINELSMKVNLENSVNLSSYIMYRKYVLSLFNNNALQLYKDNKSQNEALFHNLLLPKKTNNNIDSNLWLLDELFLYFDGASERSISDIKIKGTKIIKDLSAEEKQQLNEFNEKRLNKRIDLLFFPEEKQCIIIELKDPKIVVNENAYQMDKYAELLANFVKPEFSIEHFFTYLITDNFNKYDKPTGYRKIYNIDGFVRDSSDIKSFENDLTIANQYSEIIRYTDIYARANKRNEIFFNKLNIPLSN